jgi:hypothetical protein
VYTGNYTCILYNLPGKQDRGPGFDPSGGGGGNIDKLVAFIYVSVT